MPLLQNILNSNIILKLKRTLATTSGIYCKVKKLSPTVSEDLRVVKLLQHYRINKVLDIGANGGQFAESLIDFGYKGEIISFEPVKSIYAELTSRAAKHKQWTVADRCAVGNMNGTIKINVSEETMFSSIKSIKREYTSDHEKARVTKQEDVNIFTIDSFIGKYFNEHDRVLLKIDTQGFEKEVIEGATKTLQMAVGAKLEIPLTKNGSVYEGVEWDLKDYMIMFDKLQMQCVSIQPISANRVTGIVYEVDGVFFKNQS